MKLNAYNVAPGRSQRIVNEELTLLAQMSDLLALEELVGYSMPRIQGKLSIRDREHGESRANLGAYVDRDLYREHFWVDLKKTWPRTKHDGPHPPRSLLVIVLKDNALVVIVHMPPDVPGAGPARQECVDAIVRLTAPWTRKDWEKRTQGAQWRARARGRIVVGDMNASMPELESLGLQVARLGAHGKPVDLLLVGESVEVKGEVRYRKTVNGRRLGTDHKDGAMFSTVLL